MERKCGKCSLCCTVLNIEEIQKPAGLKCPACAKKRGCNVYQSRPQQCRDYECFWLQDKNSVLPEFLNPDQCGFFVDIANDYSRIVLHVDPDRPDAWEKGAGGQWVENMRRKTEIVIVRGDRRTLLTRAAA